MKNKDPYSSAHLVVSAIRILEHQHNAAPSVEDVCDMLQFTVEQGLLICRKLEELKIIEIVEGAFGTRLYVQNHEKIEEIPKERQESQLDQELKKFQSARKDRTKEIESFQAKQAEKKKNLFAEIEKKLKDNIEKKKT